MMKVFFRRIHLYLSLAAALVILIACLTGAILVFEKDLQMALNKKRYYVEAGAQRLSAQQLINSATLSYPGATVRGIRVYSDPDRSAELSVELPKKNTAAISKASEKAKPDDANKDGVTKGKEGTRPPQRTPQYTLFVNPYTGAVLEKYSYRETFFFTVFALHRWLLGGDSSIGKLIVGVSTFLFLFILVTGIILWWPKTRKVLQQRLTVKWGASWKRVNHDLHVVFGFYSAIFLFIFAFTGLAWSFEWFNKGIYAVTKSPLKQAPPPKSTFADEQAALSPDVFLQSAKSVYPGAQFYSLSLPKDSTEAATVTVLSASAAHEGATDQVYFDQYSGAVLRKAPFAERSLGARVRSTFKPVHTGSIGGTATKIIAFIACIFGVSFPVTGVIMWINRTRKKKRLPKGKTAELGVEAYTD